MPDKFCAFCQANTMKLNRDVFYLIGRREKDKTLFDLKVRVYECAKCGRIQLFAPAEEN